MVLLHLTFAGLHADGLTGFWEYNLNAWDVAAGKIILEEAGGKLSNFAGKKYSIYMKEILATNGKIHKNMLGVINS